MAVLSLLSSPVGGVLLERPVDSGLLAFEAELLSKKQGTARCDDRRRDGGLARSEQHASVAYQRKIVAFTRAESPDAASAESSPRAVANGYVRAPRARHMRLFVRGG